MVSEPDKLPAPLQYLPDCRRSRRLPEHRSAGGSPLIRVILPPYALRRITEANTVSTLPGRLFRENAMRLRWLEWCLLFLCLPLLLFLNLLPFSKFVYLSLAALYALSVILACKPDFTVTGQPLTQQTALRIVLVTALIFLFSRLAFPDHFLSIPALHAKIWLMILLFYPLISVLPQEFVYRRFYFWRYSTLFPNSVLLLLSNIAMFSFAHIMYGNMVAVFLSMLGGILFARSYLQSGRLLPVWIEHSLYGIAIFTSGLGHFFTSVLS